MSTTSTRPSLKGLGYTNLFNYLKRVFLFLVFLISLHVGAQQSATVDSLITVIKSEPSDSLTNSAYRSLMLHYITQTKSDSALYWGDRLLDFAEEKGYQPALITANYYKAYYNYLKGNYDNVILHTKVVVSESKKQNNSKTALDGLNRIVTTFNVIEQYDSAFYYLDQLEVYANEIRDTNSLSQVAKLSAEIYSGKGEYDMALLKYLESDSIQGTRQNPDEYLQGLAFHNVALLYFQNFQNSQKADQYAKKALARYKSASTISPNTDTRIQSLNILRARILNQRAAEVQDINPQQWNSLITQADSVIKEAVGFYNKRNHSLKLAEATTIEGIILTQQRKFKHAEGALLKALDIYKKIRRPNTIASTHNQLAKLYEATKEYEKAIYHRRESLKLPQSDFVKSQSTLFLSELLEKDGQYKAALDTLQSYIQLRDSIDAVEKNTRFREIETRYQTAQKEKEITELEINQLKSTTRNQRLLTWGIVLLSLASAMALFLWYRSRQKEKANQQLQEIDELKSKFFSNISHELRTPLSLIKGPVDTLIKNQNIDDSSKQQLSIIQRNTRRLIRLVNDLLELSRIEAGSRKLQIQEISAEDHIRTIFSNFESAAISNEQEYTYDVVSNISEVYYEPQIIETIIYNLISNAIKYSPRGATIEANATIDEATLVLSIKNMGHTIPEKDLTRIFDRFYRVEDDRLHEEGVGVGLALVKELVQTHKGKINVESGSEDGTTFEVTLPISSNDYHSSEIIMEPESVSIIESGIIPLSNEPSNINADAPIMLIVEDNPDMRTFLSTTFSDKYQIYNAENGKLGLEKAREVIPDIIISDMMMPVMDGAKMCEAIKSDRTLSHIPVIVLTAKAEEETKIETLRLGIDDYIAKPFNVDEISIKVDNLLTIRQQLQKKYASSDYQKVPDSITSSADETFWNQLKEVLDKYLTDESFTVEFFANEMIMSRMQLHRKLKALTGKSATAFIRSERLKKADALLKTNKWRVSEVAYECGFSSPFYFSKCFKEEYGMSPKDVIPK